MSNLPPQLAATTAIKTEPAFESDDDFDQMVVAHMDWDRREEFPFPLPLPLKLEPADLPDDPEFDGLLAQMDLPGEPTLEDTAATDTVAATEAAVSQPEPKKCRKKLTFEEGGSSSSGGGNSGLFQEDECAALVATCQTTARQLLSKKDQKIEEFLASLLEELQPSNLLTSADELRDQWFKELTQRINELSLTLSHKMASLIHHALEQKIEDCLGDMYAVLEMDPLPPTLMAEKYRLCFDAWVDAQDCVSIRAGNPRLLGKLPPRDYFVLLLFTFATSKRIRGDDLLMLCITGESSVGKTTLFENCLLEGSHIQCNEEGVGRFKTGGKNILFFHDIPITKLWIGKDAEKVRTITRGELTVAKVHSGTQMVAPLFVLVTSNMRLMDHKFPHPKTAHPGGTLLYPSQAAPAGSKRQQHNRETLKAMQMRFLEVYCRKAPAVDPDHFPKHGCFQRGHMIVGLYSRVFALMKQYDKTDFYTPVLAQYVLTGLCKNANIFQEVAENGCIGGRLETLIDKFADPKQAASLRQML